MIGVETIDKLAQKLASFVPPGVTAAREDLQANFRDVLTSGLQHLDLVTRQEFDVQREVLAQTRKTVDDLERRVTELEGPATPGLESGV